MWNAGLDEAHTGIKIARRSINNLRYTDDTTLMTETKVDLKSLLMKVKEDSETRETVTDFFFLGSKITADGEAAMKLKDAYSLEEKLWLT